MGRCKDPQSIRSSNSDIDSDDDGQSFFEPPTAKSRAWVPIHSVGENWQCPKCEFMWDWRCDQCTHCEDPLFDDGETELDGGPRRVPKCTGRQAGEHHNSARGVRLIRLTGVGTPSPSSLPVNCAGDELGELKVKSKKKVNIDEACVAEELECDANAVNGQKFGVHRQ